MKQRIDQSMPTIGGTSLLVIFGVLCLVVFSLLSLNTVLAEQRISEAYARQTEQWYAADLQAQEIFARLRSGEVPSQVTFTDGIYAYRIPISQHSRLEVALQNTDQHWSILRWQLIAELPENDQPIGVWTQQEETP